MIHSMSCGVIKDAGSYTFVKVVFDGDETPYWYISEFPVDEGDRVSAPFGRANMPRVGRAVRVEKNVSGQVTPIPLRSAKKLISRLITDGSDGE